MTNLEQMAQAPLGDNILASIAQTAREILEAQDEVSRREEALRDAKRHLVALQEQVMPELMAEAGQEELTTADGLKVSLKEMIRGQPTQENQGSAFAWLRDNGQGGIIKSKVQADLGKADPDRVDAALKALAGVGIPAVTREEVHWQTLGALVREMLAQGQEVPLDLLGVTVWRQAVVKPK